MRLLQLFNKDLVPLKIGKSSPRQNFLETRKDEKGIKKGETKRNFEIAKVMKLNNEPIEKIMKYTQLTREQIGRL